VWLIASMADPDEPDLRGYTITGAEIEEVELTIE
jgi:hypothetical protein